MFKKKTEELKETVKETTEKVSEKVGEKITFVTIGMVAAVCLTGGYIAGAISSAILLQGINKVAK